MEDNQENKNLVKKEKNKNQSEIYQGVGAFVLEIVKIIILTFVIIYPIRAFFFQPFFVKGASMEPNFEDGQYLIINELGLKETRLELRGKVFFNFQPFKDLEREEVVVFRYPRDPQKFFIKRVIGLPGEKIEIKDGKVTIFNRQNLDGFVLDEKKYLSSKVKTTGDQIVDLGEEEYFVMGDNRAFSSDSRFWGPINKKDVMGKVMLRAWPINKATTF